MDFLLVLYFLLLPFQFALSPMEGVDLALARLGALGLVLLYGIRGFFLKRLVFPVSIEAFLMSGFLFLALLSIVWSENLLFALRKGVFLLSFLPLFFLLLALLREREPLRYALAKAYTVGAAAVAFLGVLLFFSQFVFGHTAVFSFLTTSLLPFFLGESFAQSVIAHPSLFVNISGVTLLRTSAFFPDPHMLAFYLGLALPVSVFFAVRSKSVLWWILTGTLLLADILTFSRGGYVGIFLTAFGALSLFPGLFIRKGGTAFLLIVAGIGCLSLFFMSPAGDRLFSSFSPVDTSNMERIRLWNEALGHISENLFLGVGLGNYPLTVKPDAGYRDPIYVHNTYLDVTVELGIIGGGFFLALLALAFFRAMQSWRIQHDSFGLSVAGSIALFSVHAIFDTALFSVHVLPALLLFLALGVSCKYHAKHP